MARIRSLTARLGDAFETSPFPSYVLSEQRRILFCNPALLEWTKLSTEKLIGIRCDFHSNLSGGQGDTATAESIVAGLCPPPDCLIGLPGHCVVAVSRGVAGLSSAARGLSRWVVQITLNRSCWLSSKRTTFHPM